MAIGASRPDCPIVEQAKRGLLVFAPNQWRY
jgi:hypothetical protein